MALGRLTKLTIMVQIMIAIGLLMLASQAAPWAEFGKLNGQVAQIDVQLTQAAVQMASIENKLDQLTARQK